MSRQSKQQTRPVYNRGLCRKILRARMKTNKIKGVWHQIRG